MNARYVSQLMVFSLSLMFSCQTASAGDEKSGATKTNQPATTAERNTAATTTAPTATTAGKVTTKCPGDSSKVDTMVVMVFDDHCIKWCDIVKPIMRDLAAKYPEMKVVEIDASRKVMKEARATAKQLNICGFLPGALEYIPMVGIFKKGELVEELPGAKKPEVYEAAVQRAFAKK